MMIGTGRQRIRLKERLLRIFGSSASLRDALVLFAAMVLAILLEVYVDLLPAIGDWVRQHPAWQIDKLFTLLLILTIGFFVFAICRIREIGADACRRSDLESRFRDFVAMADEWFWEMDDQFRLTVVDDRAPAPLVALARQRAPWQLDGRSVSDDAWARHRAELAARKPFRSFRFHLTDEAGRAHHMQISGKPFLDRDGGFAGYRGTGSDVTSVVSAETASAHLARFDPLTDLPNRAGLRDDLEHAVSLVRHHGRPAALLCIDLDRFQEINDTLGPAIGDRLLDASARRLRGCIGGDDRLARISGDEFAIVQSGPDQPDGSAALCRRILDSFAAPFEIDGQEVLAGASIGIAVIGPDQSNDEVLKCAGIALYRAKREGRATFCQFEPWMESLLRERRALEWDIKRGLEDDEFQLVYQPQIDPGTRAVVGLEVVVRWLHPDRGRLEAKDFMTDADETSMILPLGGWLLDTGCAQAAGWPEVRIAVNLSPVQFHHRDLADLVGRALRASDLEPHRLELGIPERALLPDPQAAARVLERLDGLGVRLALSDFAGGFTSLAHRHGLIFDQVKIDRLFASSLAERPDAQAAAHAIEAIAHGLGREVCVEGIETAEQEVLVTTAGCTVVQGGRYGGPVGASEVEAMLGGRHGTGTPDAPASAA